MRSRSARDGNSIGVRDRALPSADGPLQQLTRPLLAPTFPLLPRVARSATSFSPLVGSVRGTDCEVRQGGGTKVLERRSWMLLGLLCFVSLAGCSGKVITVDGATVLVSERATSGMDAALAAELQIVGGCLGAGGSVVIWPFGTRVIDEDPLTIEIPDNGTFVVGEEVTVGGGFVLEHSSVARDPGPLEVSGVTVPTACADHDVFLAR